LITTPLTDVTDPETILRIVQFVPSPKAEPIKLWLAKVGYERRMQDMRTRHAPWIERGISGSRTAGIGNQDFVG
jgi:hypothetical protein